MSEDLTKAPSIEPNGAHRVDLGSAAATSMPSVVCVREDNPGMFTGPGTNTFLIGDERLWVLDPGEVRDDGHREAILDAVDGRPIDGVLISHGHADHWPLGEQLAREWGVDTYGFASHGDFVATQQLADGQRLEGDRFVLETLHTPGHCADHLSFALGINRNTSSEDEGARGPVIFCGDHVMAWSTTILAPPDGSLNQYLASLDRLIDLGPSLLVPAHGPTIADPRARMIELREHRLQRTQQLLAALESGPLTLEQAVPIIYTDTDPQLYGAAAASLHAHAEALLEDGVIEQHDDVYQLS